MNIYILTKLFMKKIINNINKLFIFDFTKKYFNYK